MRLLRAALISAAIIGSVSLVACGGSTTPDADPFATFAACYVEHHVTESFDVQKAIVICCLDHPIGGQKAGVVCGSDAASCTAYVSAQVGSAGSGGSGTLDATAADIGSACSDYQTQKGM